MYVVDSTGLTFVNHGCRGTGNVGLWSSHHESNLAIPQMPTFLDETKEGSTTLSLDDWLHSKIPADYLADQSEECFYFPIRRPADRVNTESNQFIPAGSEILDNYLSFNGILPQAFWENVAQLQLECGGQPGFIERWERDLDDYDDNYDNEKKRDASHKDEL